MNKKYYQILVMFPYWVLGVVSVLYYGPVRESLKQHHVPLAGPAYIGLILCWLLTVFLVARSTKKAAIRDEDGVPLFHRFSISITYILSLVACWFFLFSLHYRVDFVFHVVLCFLVSTLILANLLALYRLPGNGKIKIETHFSKYRKIYSNVMLASASLMLSIMLPEIIFRLLITSERSQYHGYGTRGDFILSPYLMFAEPDIRNGGSLNSQGFQGVELSATRGKNEVRIALLGGSAAWAGGTANSIAGNLERLLMERYPNKKIRVLNFGRQSYVSMQELILLQRNVLALSPNLIIIYDGFNDIWVPYSGVEPMGVGYPFLYSNLKERVERNNVVNFGILFNYLSSRSALFNYARSILLKAGAGRNVFDIDKCVTEYENNLYKMCVLSSAYKSKIILSTQPYVGSKNLKTPNENALIKKYDLEKIRLFYDKLATTASEVAVRTGSYYINTLDVFNDNKGDIFYDAVHVSPEIGNPIIAMRLAEEIVRLNLI